MLMKDAVQVPRVGQRSGTCIDGGITEENPYKVSMSNGLSQAE